MPTPKVNSWLGWRNFTVNNVETFLDDILEVQGAPIESAADAEAGASQAFTSKDKASPEFTIALELTIQRGDDPVKTLLWLRGVKNFRKVKTLLQLLLTMKVLVRLLEANY
jgi:hypothetical protein